MDFTRDIPGIGQTLVHFRNIPGVIGVPAHSARVDGVRSISRGASTQKVDDLEGTKSQQR
jgi:hypothetical protein